MLSGSVCKFRDFSSPWFKIWSDRTKIASLHRKTWEWNIISQILDERDMLRPGRLGIGFAVGTEPLASLFASRGATIHATDIAAGEVADAWAQSNEHADGLEAAFRPHVIERAVFEERVRFFNADMNDLESLPSETYDFAWSSCAMEHLGSLDHGLNFVANAMRLLKVGGVAVHTTEFNIADLEDTLEEGSAVIYRESDFHKLDGMLRKRFCYMEPMDFNRGYDREDILYDSAPWGEGGHPHIKIELHGFICTSAVMICHRVA